MKISTIAHPLPWFAVLALAGCASPATPSPAAPSSTPVVPSSSATVTPAPGPLPSPTSNPLAARPGHIALTGGGTADYAYRGMLQIPVGTAWGPDGHLYIADWTGRHIVRVDKDFNMDEVDLGNTMAGLEYDGPRDVAFDSKGDLYFNSHDFIFRVGADGGVTQLQGIQGGPLGSIEFGPDGVLYYTDRAEQGAVRKWDPAGKSETVADGLAFPDSMVFGRDGTLYLTHLGQPKVSKIDVAAGTASVFQEDACGYEPCFLAVDPEGDLWVRGFNRLSQFAPGGTVKDFTVDGDTYPGGPNFWQTAAGIAFDDAGGLWIAAFDSSLIRLAPVQPGKSDPEYELQKGEPGFQASSLAVGMNGELYATNFNSRELWRIGLDGAVGVLTKLEAEGRAAVAVDDAGTVFVGLPNGWISRLETDGTLSDFAEVTTRRMTFAADGNLYAVVGEIGQPKSVARISATGEVETLTLTGGVSLNEGEAHICAARDEGLYIFTERGRDLFLVDFTGAGRLIANLKPLGGVWNPAAMAASPVTGDVYIIPHGPYALFRITPDGKPEEMARRFFGDPWAMAVSRDGKWLYVAESGVIDRIPL